MDPDAIPSRARPSRSPPRVGWTARRRPQIRAPTRRPRADSQPDVAHGAAPVRWSARHRLRLVDQRAARDLDVVDGERLVAALGAEDVEQLTLALEDRDVVGERIAG